MTLSKHLVAESWTAEAIDEAAAVAIAMTTGTVIAAENREAMQNMTGIGNHEAVIGAGDKDTETRATVVAEAVIGTTNGGTTVVVVETTTMVVRATSIKTKIRKGRISKSADIKKIMNTVSAETGNGLDRMIATEGRNASWAVTKKGNFSWGVMGKIIAQKKTVEKKERI